MKAKRGQRLWEGGDLSESIRGLQERKRKNEENPRSKFGDVPGNA